MFGYYVDLARRSFRRNAALTALMVLAIAFGVGASMTTLTVLRILAADPIPQKSDHLYYVQLEPRKTVEAGDPEPIEQVTRRDAEALVRAHKADRQAMMTGGSAGIEPEKTGLPPFVVSTRWTSNEIFALFDIPFVAGQGWTADDDDHAARVVVITRALAEKVYGSTNVVGYMLRVAGTPMRVTGVTEDWSPAPHFHDLWTQKYGQGEQLFVPFSTSRDLKLEHDGNMNCFGGDGVIPDPTALGAPCEWIQLWVELDSPDKARAYKEFLEQYSRDEKAAGRYYRDPNVRLRTVMEWLAHKEVVPSDARLQTWIALGFLLVCLINTVGLLLTKFLRRSSEIGVRRALGASKRSIFVQLIIEAGAIGCAGGVLGLGFAWLGLLAVRHQPTSYAHLAHLDLPMLLATLGLAIAAALLAGLLPAWRACQVAPALQLKSH